ncbi:MAG: HAMP domain-containing histidine kinase, partial [Desulfobacterales bacterium]|nr:HAMP domain-containing histidine kinase [Desulfobacterales bacterium]
DENIAAMFKMVVDNFRPQIEDKQITLEFNAEGTYLANVSLMIEEVFVNLLSNAIKYSPEKSKIIVDITDAGDDWRVSVTDQGEGVSDENKPLLFDRFQRVNKVAVKGSGLGLAIVKRIIELHEGDFGVDDNPDGVGSVFWVTVKKSN